ncbi:MAG: MotA/TolQ/ExbB proton channel family protein [Limnohabitans sp.]|jgi:biopolymer transport protein ExbB|nr:MotA/TolQ/ExbB proton channel family protein [Limnohabitans sp.]
MSMWSLLTQGDALLRLLSLVLLAMSVFSWMVILYKAVLLHVAQRDLSLCQACLLQAPDWAQAQAQWRDSDRWQLFPALMAAVQASPTGALAASAAFEDQLTRRLREALHSVRARLQWGQDGLATIGATAPFVGLLGTVWGIFHALTNLAGAGQYTLDKVAQPVGEALVMTAAGLAVAIPAVMAYNLLGRRLARLDSRLEGLAFDLRALAQAGKH